MMMLGLMAMVAAAQATSPAPAPDYARDEAWLCLPGRSDACGQVLPTVALNPNGYGSVGEARPDADAEADCFYVYPTVSRDPGTNSDLDAGQEEIAAAYTQVARFSGTCRTFAPIYRQLTLAALMQAQGGGGQEAIGRGFVIAYADVKAAWAQFLAQRNNDRPFVLVGHSQGSIHLMQLIKEEIEGTPVAERMLSAILLGWNVEVPEGAVVGGSFASTPLCTERGQRGCVISYVSFARDMPPPAEGAIFGRAPTPGSTVACTNPAILGEGRAPLDSYWFTGRPDPRPIRWSSEGPPPVVFARTEGLAYGECVQQGPVGYLAIDVPATPDDARTDRIPGEVGLPGWGLHLADMPVAQGDLIGLVEAQIEGQVAAKAEAGRRRRP